METNKRDEKLFRAAGYSFEYPGFWDKTVGKLDATVSDGKDRGVWVVQIVTDEGGTFLGGADAKTAKEAIEKAAALVEVLGLFVEMGFEEWHTGGGCMALRRDFPVGQGGKGYILVTDNQGDGIPDSMTDELIIGFYDEDGNDRHSIDDVKGAKEARKIIVAHAFASLLGEALTDAQWKEMLERNRDEKQSGICHSHDYLDANEVMSSAVQLLGFKIYDDKGEMLDSTLAIWNAAWRYATDNLIGGHLRGGRS